MENLINLVGLLRRCLDISDRLKYYDDTGDILVLTLCRTHLKDISKSIGNLVLGICNPKQLDLALIDLSSKFGIDLLDVYIYRIRNDTLNFMKMYSDIEYSKGVVDKAYFFIISSVRIGEDAEEMGICMGDSYSKEMIITKFISDDFINTDYIEKNLLREEIITDNYEY